MRRIRKFAGLLIRSARKIDEKWERLLWTQRWNSRRASLEPADKKPITSVEGVFTDLAIVVISLETRQDRREKFATVMKSFGLARYEMIDAIDGPTTFQKLPRHRAATKACSESHKIGLERGLSAGKLAVMVCEDDIEFLENKKEVGKILQEFLGDSRLDVLCLSARVRGGRLRVSENLSVATRIVTGACYVVKPHVAQALTDNFAESSRRVSRGLRKSALDQNWHKLQTGRYFFAVPNKKIVKIAAGYSDIQGKFLPDVL
jgi:hypothetical protein